MKQVGQFRHYTERVGKDRLGFVTAAVRRTYAEEEIDMGSLPPAPINSINGAIWTRTDIDGNEGSVTVRWIYEGLGENYSAGSLKEIWEFDPSFDEVPIQSHPDFEKFKKDYGWDEVRQRFVKSTATKEETQDRGLGLGPVGAGSSGKKDSMLGIESFLRMGGVWRKSYAALSLPGGIFSRTGTIVGSPPGPVPSLPSGRNWLKAPPRIRFRGNAWEITEEWILSGLGGWNRKVYDGSTERG